MNTTNPGHQRAPVEPAAVLKARAEHLVDQTGGMLHALHRRRTDAGLTVEDVASRLGVHTDWVTEMEGHDANPTLSQVRRYALAVGARIHIAVTDDTTAPVAGFQPVSDTGAVFVDGTNVCARCGRDETGKRWPDCAEIKARTEGVIEWDHNTIHAATCGRYWSGEDMWMCPTCETELRGDAVCDVRPGR